MQILKLSPTEGVGDTPRPVDETTTTQPVDLGPQHDNSQFHILVADSNADTNNIMSLLLSNEGYTVISVKNHDEALQSLKTTQRSFNLVITNQSGKGLQVIEEAKKCSPSTKVLLCTGNTFAEKGLADDVITKPFNFACSSNSDETSIC